MPFHPPLAQEIAIVGLFQVRFVSEQLPAGFDKSCIPGLLKPQCLKLKNGTERVIAANLARHQRSRSGIWCFSGRLALSRNSNHPAIRGMKKIHAQCRRNTLWKEFGRLAPVQPVVGAGIQLTRRLNVLVLFTTVPRDVEPALPATHVYVVMIGPSPAVD